MDDDPVAEAPRGDPAGTTTAAPETTETPGTPDADVHGTDGSGPPETTDDAPIHGPIEPESVNPEHAAFVLLGAALTLVVVASVL